MNNLHKKPDFLVTTWLQPQKVVNQYFSNICNLVTCNYIKQYKTSKIELDIKEKIKMVASFKISKKVVAIFKKWGKRNLTFYSVVYLENRVSGYKFPKIARNLLSFSALDV